jgi:putative nucleotidyltransferase with HDIG domain
MFSGLTTAEDVIDAMTDGLAVFDDGGELISWNAAAEAMTGWSRGQARKRIDLASDTRLIELDDGQWVRAHRFELRHSAGRHRAVLLSDACDEIRAVRERDALEHRVRERTGELERTQIEVLERLAQAAEFRDDQTGDHTRRVGMLAADVASELGLPARDIDLLRQAAPLHDIGKIGVPDTILLKPARLNAAEVRTMRLHTTIGAEILSGPRFALLCMAREIALTHHEHWDGGGYPSRLSGGSIPLVGRIVAVVDVYDALTHRRAYKRAWPTDEALDELRRGRGRHFDPRVIDAFMGLEDHLVALAPSRRFERAKDAAAVIVSHA